MTEKIQIGVMLLQDKCKRLKCKEAAANKFRRERGGAQIKLL